jgi:hypothetical protein
MVWVLSILAVLALAGAAGCLWYRRRLGQEIGLMAAIQTSRAAEVARLAPGTAVEVKGTLRCAAPLVAEFSQTRCAYHKSEIQREIVEYRRGSDGKDERHTRTEPMHSNVRHARCTVEDKSGAVALNLDGADIEGEQVVNRREAEQRGVAAVLVNVALGGGGGATLIYSETILVHDIPIYVLGEVQADRSIGKPAANSGNRVFVVSRKSEEERSKDIGSTMTWLAVGAAILIAAAAVLGYFALRA